MCLSTENPSFKGGTQNSYSNSNLWNPILQIERQGRGVQFCSLNFLQGVWCNPFFPLSSISMSPPPLQLAGSSFLLNPGVRVFSASYCRAISRLGMVSVVNQEVSREAGSFQSWSPNHALISGWNSAPPKPGLGSLIIWPLSQKFSEFSYLFWTLPFLLAFCGSYASENTQVLLLTVLSR